MEGKKEGRKGEVERNGQKDDVVGEKGSKGGSKMRRREEVGENVEG